MSAGQAQSRLVFTHSRTRKIHKHSNRRKSYGQSDLFVLHKHIWLSIWRGCTALPHSLVRGAAQLQPTRGGEMGCLGCYTGVTLASRSQHLLQFDQDGKKTIYISYLPDHRGLLACFTASGAYPSRGEIACWGSGSVMDCGCGGRASPLSSHPLWPCAPCASSHLPSLCESFPRP